MASIFTTSNGITLAYNGPRYYKNRATLNKIHWRCSLRSCRSPLQSKIFSNDQNVHVLSVGSHNHNPTIGLQNFFKEDIFREEPTPQQLNIATGIYA